MTTSKAVRRFDYGELREATKTSQGFLLIPAFATRTGVFTYMDGNGEIRRELRHPDDVFAPESLCTLKYAPVTIEHPPEMLTPSNVGKYQVGHVTERVEVNRDLVDTDVIIEHQEAIDAVEKEGMRETSSGYLADVVEEVGEFNGAPYNYRQKNIKYNHLAIVRRGRAGPEVRLRLDAADAVMQDGEVPQPPAAVFSQESAVSDSDLPGSKKVVIMGQEVDLPSEIADVVQDMMDRFDEMRAKLYQLEDEMSGKVRKDQKDEDVGQKGISPQVAVEQQTPDGRSSSGKNGPGSSAAIGGTRTGTKSDEDVVPPKKDEDPEGVVGGAKPNDRGAGAAALKDAGGAPAADPMSQMKSDMETMRAGMDAMQAKIDEYASASMGKDEKKPDGKMDSAEDQKKAIRSRVKLERHAEKFLPVETVAKFDGMSDDEIRKAVIKHVRPNADLEGKSETYLQARFDSIVETHDDGESAETRRNAGRAMLVEGSTGNERMDAIAKADPKSARLSMVHGSRDMWKQPLSASKK